MLNASDPTSLDDAALFRFYHSARSARISFEKKIRNSEFALPGEPLTDICLRLGASHTLVQQFVTASRMVDAVISEMRKRGLALS